MVPTTPVTQLIDYNMRFLISVNQTNPIAWEVSKREDTFPPGITQIVLKQVPFNPMTDNKELMIADYYSSNIIPEKQEDAEIKDQISELLIKHSTSATVKVGGSYKVFSVDPKDYKEYDPNLVTWKITGLDKQDYTTLLSPETPDTIKIKISKDYALIGKTFTLELYYSDSFVTSKEIEVVSL